MREIKFRAWDKKHEEMINVSMINWGGETMLTKQTHKDNIENFINAKMFRFVDLCIKDRLDEAKTCLNDCERDIRSAQLLFGRRE